MGADKVQIVSYLAKSASELSAARHGGSSVHVGPTWGHFLTSWYHKCFRFILHFSCPRHRVPFTGTWFLVLDNDI